MVYASTYPFDFHRAGSLRILLHSPGLSAARYVERDVVLNILFYVPVGAAAYSWLRERWKPLPSIAGAIILGTALSFCLEWIQVFDRTRYPTLLDVMANGTGSAAGVLVAIMLTGLIANLPHNLDRGALMLLIFAILNVAISVYLEKTLTIGPAIALIYTALIFYRIRGLPVLLVATLLIRGLMPFRFDADNDFNWIPFAGLIESNWRTAVTQLLDKGTYYGLAVWTTARGMNYVKATLIVATTLLAIEFLQTKLPGRTPEITDPILAILLAIILEAFSKRTSSPSGTSA